MNRTTNFLAQSPRPQLAKRLNIAAWVISAVVLILVGLMRRVKIPLPEGVDLSMLPAWNAALNAATAVTLIIALVFIKQKKYRAHRNAMYVAISLSAAFLLIYVAYHFTTPEVLFGDADGDGVLSTAELATVGGQRTAYLILLASHIILAAVIFPFILFTYIRAYTNQFAKHRQMARWVFPIWLYVAITGPVVYWMLSPYY